MKQLVEFSRRYGSDPELTVAGGGNTSLKENGILYVKGSGAALGTITEEGFVALSMEALSAIAGKTYPADEAAADALFLADVMAARLPGQVDRRPSIETLLHALFPQRYVLHLHPNLINGMTCAAKGEETAKRLFPDVPWVGEGRPGRDLAMKLKDKVTGGADTVLLQNHGVFFAADTPEALDKMLRAMLETVENAIREGYDPACDHPARPEAPFTPDQVMYCGLTADMPDTYAARQCWEGAKKIARYTASFGGQRSLSPETIRFLLGWEAETYRMQQLVP